jgi:hypothetical protein
LTFVQVTERTVRAALEGGDLTKTVITIGEEDLPEEAAPLAPVARAPSLQRRGSRAQEETVPRPAPVPAPEEAATGLRKPLPKLGGSKIPRRHQFSGVTVHNVEFEKGPGVRKGLGFSVVGGIDSPRGDQEVQNLK